MIVKSREKKEVLFRDIKVGQVFKNDEGVFVKIRLEDDYIVCPRCDEDIHITDINCTEYAVELTTGLAYEISGHIMVEPIQGYFVEE